MARPDRRFALVGWDEWTGIIEGSDRYSPKLSHLKDRVVVALSLLIRCKRVAKRRGVRYITVTSLDLRLFLPCVSGGFPGSPSDEDDDGRYSGKWKAS